jgi:hypothetical protein
MDLSPVLRQTVKLKTQNPNAARSCKGTDGNFYGTNAHGGTVFKVTPGGIPTKLAVVGGFAYAGLVQATDGNF